MRNDRLVKDLNFYRREAIKIKVLISSSKSENEKAYYELILDEITQIRDRLTKIFNLITI